MEPIRSRRAPTYAPASSARARRCSSLRVSSSTVPISRRYVLAWFSAELLASSPDSLPTAWNSRVGSTITRDGEAACVLPPAEQCLFGLPQLEKSADLFRNASQSTVG